MTREEHIAWLKAIRDSISGGDEEFDNKRRESLDAGISALSQEPCERFEWGIDGNVYKITKAKDGKEICQQVCDDAISREDVEECKELMTDINGDIVYAVRMSDIRQLPSVTQKSGKWINKDVRKEEYVLIGKCSICGQVRVKDKFCSNCGAKMVEPQESEE